MPEYYGHKNWSHWNVALWLGNDEALYREAIRLKRKMGTKRAAETLLDLLPDKTPDGAKYNITNITAALRGLE